MVASFGELMAMSASQTQQSEAAVKAALAEKMKREEQRRKQQEEKERKEKELEKRLRLKYLEEEQRRQEREARLAKEREAKERALEKRKAEERAALLYGPKRAKSEYPSSSARRATGESQSDDSDSGHGTQLTREEKRRRKFEAELRYGQKSSKRSSGGSGYGKMGRRLPGGALDIVAGKKAGNGEGATGGYRSVKERLAAEVPTLTALNQDKRDTRTIDEFTRDLKAKKEGAKILEGDAARTFDDWFGTSKKKSGSPPKSSQVSSVFGSRASSMEHDSAPTKPSQAKSATPPVQPKPSITPKSSSAVTSSTSKSTLGSFTKTPSLSTKATGKLPASSGSLSAKSPATSKPGAKPLGSLSKSMSTPRPSAPTSSKLSASAGAPSSMKKRPRSDSLSPRSRSPPPVKRRMADDISSQIWQMFGKNRDKYISRDVFSDDEDMEAGVSDVEKEERISARIARKEDELALEEERRHEEEKRRRRKEKEARERGLF